MRRTTMLASMVLTVSASLFGQPVYSLMHVFTGIPADGDDPQATMVRDAAGNMYGTTHNGGAAGLGAIFKLDAAGNEHLLYSFAGSPADGANPTAGVIRDSAGNLYGTTNVGGTWGQGTILKLDAAGTETVLYSFGGSPADGQNPTGIIRDANGDFYGTTYRGGASGLGTVFKLNAAGQETVLHNFAGPPSDGASPGSGVIPDAKGNLYGTTYIGGPSDDGTVFQLTRPAEAGGAWTESLVHSFMGAPADGADPVGGLIWDPAGNLYGTTYAGGASNYGTVMELIPPAMPGGAWTEKVLYSFNGAPDGDGQFPWAGVIRDSAGNLYGTTYSGGPVGNGTIYKVDPTGVETVLFAMPSLSLGDGIHPVAGLVQDPAGNLYGVNTLGGAHNATCRFGCGVVFKLVP